MGDYTGIRGARPLAGGAAGVAFGHNLRDRLEAEPRDDRDEASAYATRARRLGLSFVPVVDLGPGAAADIPAIGQGSFAMSSAGERLAYIAPAEAAMPDIHRWLAAHPAARPRLRVSTPSAIRAALVRSDSDRLMRGAVNRLEDRDPDFSARRVATKAQAATAIALAVGIAVALLLAPIALVIAINLVGAAFFFGVSALRFIAAGLIQPVDEMPLDPDDGDLPTYTVLVPLYGEAGMVAGLAAALEDIDWPRERLDIKLIVEAADRPTIAAARRAVTGAPFEIVVVPDGGPQTKPRALSFALQFARGEFVTVYDAEDRPHPGQLRQAYAAFREAPPEVACFQSSLVIDNADDGWLSLLFSIEYAALFDGLLPALATLSMPLPLGGTSNHFRRAALERVGGWDPYNVTEDADLGLRLARFGYRAATLSLPTLEDAPTELGPWLRQRTRWFKGWMQTWLVHTRDPLRLFRELGARGLLGFALIGTGMIVSSLIYPVYLVTLLAMVTHPLTLWGDGGIIASGVVGVNLFNLVAGYVAMAVLSGRALRRRDRDRETAGLLLLPVYWFLMSLASYRAVLQLIRRPHHWEKTPHRRRAGA